MLDLPLTDEQEPFTQTSGRVTSGARTKARHMNLVTQNGVCENLILS